MKFSIWPNPARPVQEVLNLARMGDTDGWYCFWYADHYMENTGDESFKPGPVHECWTVLPAIAAVTERIRLGPLVSPTSVHHPALLANRAATLDQLSNGRLMIGTGTGHVEAESKALGVDFSKRGRMHDEYLRVIRAILSSEEASFEGEFVSFGPLRTLIRSVQSPAPPFYTGGNGPRAIRRAIELGDGWLPNAADAEGLAKGIELLEITAKEMGRTELPRIAVSLPNRIRLQTPSARAGSKPLMSAAEAIAELKAYEVIGVDHVALGLLMPNVDVYIEQIEAFARDILPAFR